MLLDPFEEQLHLPTAFVELGDGQSRKALEVLKENRARTEAEFQRSLFDELAKAEQKAAALTQDVLKAGHRTKLQLLSAPVDGVVQQLAVHTVGGVVTPAQALAMVVPLDSQLEIEAMVPNRDIGFVHPGQDAHIKVDTFNFTKYGLLYGKVLSVSQEWLIPLTQVALDVVCREVGRVRSPGRTPFRIPEGIF